MTFSKPKRSPSTFATALKTEVANIATGGLLRKREGRIYHFEAFHLPARLIWKRCLDILLSSAALILLFPLMLLVAILIKTTSRGPVLFKQERIGINRRRIHQRHRRQPHPFGERRNGDRRRMRSFGKPFLMYKFRTMVTDAEKDGLPKFAFKGDPRITPLGAILRKTRIDEFPQFFNVLKGDMSVVGPRPERAYFINEIDAEIPSFKYRLRAKPGITGLAQVELGYANDTEGMHKKLRFDLKYIQSIGIISDIKILYRTIFVVLTGKGAY
jgi:lipopolysaccharide/colanic/teichoic acid biosynthesis glycosyltransferase